MNFFFSTLKLLYSPTTRQKRGVAASQSSVGYLVRSMLSPRRLLKLLGRLLCGSAPELVRYRNRMKRRCSQTAAAASGGSAIEADVLPNRMRHRTIFAPIYVAHLNKNRLPYTKYINVAKKLESSFKNNELFQVRWRFKNRKQFLWKQTKRKENR